MRSGDLVRYITTASGGATYNGLRIMKTVRISNVKTTTITPTGEEKNALKEYYKPTHLTVEDCIYLSKNEYKVKLRTLDYEHHKVLCEESSQSPVSDGTWKVIVQMLTGKSFLASVSSPSQTARGRIHTQNCNRVIPTCCLTLGLEKATVVEEFHSVEVETPFSDIEAVIVNKTADSHELLHGKKEEKIYDFSEGERGAILPTLAPEGWDNLRKHQAYCNGDWLIENVSGPHWTIKHPTILVSNSFDNPYSAAEFVEKKFLK